MFLALMMFGGLCVIHAQVSTGTISGRIVSGDGDPLEMVSVSLTEIRKGTLTDTKGIMCWPALCPVGIPSLLNSAPSMFY